MIERFRRWLYVGFPLNVRQRIVSVEVLASCALAMFATIAAVYRQWGHTGPAYVALLVLLVILTAFTWVLEHRKQGEIAALTDGYTGEDPDRAIRIAGNIRLLLSIWACFVIGSTIWYFTGARLGR